METKNSTPVTIVFEKAHSGAKGLFYIFKIKFENGDEGKFFCANEMQDIFTEGVAVSYTIEESRSGNYTNYIIKPVKSAKQAFASRKADPVSENKRVALRCAVDLACTAKIPLDRINVFAESFMKFLS